MDLYADIAGFIWEQRIKLRQLWTCGMSLSHNCMGKLMLVEARAAMNASLNVWMACSVAFTRWLCGLMSCNSHLFSDRNFLIYFVAWLSIMFSLGLNPLAVSSSKCFLYALNMVLSSRPAMGVAKMQFDL
jgi:hypothetical protein